MEELETPANNAADLISFSDDFDSACSTPFVSAPSSPGRGPTSSYGGGFFYSAPASPIHFMLSSNLGSSNSTSSTPLEGAGGSFEFEFTAKQAAHGALPTGSMTSADELFLNGKIRPMKLSSHLQRPQVLAPLLDVDENEIGDGSDDEDKLGRGRDLKFRDRSKSLRRRARSMSPLRTNNAFQWLEEFEDGRESTEINEIKEKLEAEDKAKADEDVQDAETPPSGASSRSSSVGRSSKRWVFLKEFLYRSKSEGRSSTSSNGNHKFWTSLSFSPSTNKDKKSSDTSAVKNKATTATTGDGSSTAEGAKTTVRKAVNGVGVTGKRRVARSAHELHYTTNRAQAEELRKKTYLPYKQGLLGCLGFSSKSYGAMNGFARALNPVSSR
ncbi:uncharacterized protein LOC112519676 [Cynara cardunculus var. scolymus]|uniref:Calmodulin-binding protein n=1 Tax=Cynara cardunculus var. scolymus TaxID=59895 RepID=A0A118JZG6_CYNCS|nr:uncharacterized protein LOC112519676 [Cynara cardunculus var. scolymus]KVH99911.1 Protein of unknown function DUF1645 [Cynara cardunculus var. scolymus]